MKWTVLTVVMFITTSFATGEEEGTNAVNGDPSKDEYKANYNEMEITLRTCAIPSKNMFVRPVKDGQQQGSEFDRFCYFQALENPLSRYLCQYYKYLVENYYGQYCSDPNRQPMDTTAQYQLMLQTPSAPCKKLVETVMQEVKPGDNQPVFTSTDDCETICHQSQFCTNLAYVIYIYQTNTSGGGGGQADGSLSGDGEGNGEITEGVKGSGVDNLQEGLNQGGGGEGNKIPEAVTGDQKSGDGLGDDKTENGDNGVDDESNMVPPLFDQSTAQDKVPGDASNGLPPPADLSPAPDGVPGGDSEEPLTFDNEGTGKSDEDNPQNKGTEETEELEEEEDGQIPFNDADMSSFESGIAAGDEQLLDGESSDDDASKQDFYGEGALKPGGGFDEQDKGESNEQLPNIENQQQVISKNQNTYQEEMNRLEEEEASSHFLAYSLTAIILIMVTYILYHNKQKIVAIIIEGRNGPNGKRRRYNQNVYTTVNEMA